MKKRITIFFFYDEKGKVDSYIPYYLDSLRLVSQYILVVCNGVITPEGRKIFEEHTDEFFCRENKGLDTEAFKEAILYLGWEKLCEYDELILANFTLFGPFYPLKEMFDIMDRREVDYWGVFKVFEDTSRTTLYGKDVLPYHHVLDHTSSNFRVIRKVLFHSYEFRNYWESMPPINDYRDSVLHGEICFNKIFRDAGYVFDTFMSDDTRGACPSPNVNESMRLIAKERLPFLRRRVWFSPYSEIFNYGYGDEPYKILEYIDKNTDYDVSMIYENLIRTIPMNTLKDRLQLNFIANENVSFLDGAVKRKIAVICHLFYEDCLDQICVYFNSFPKDTDFYVTVSDEKMVSAAKEKLAINAEVTLIPNRGRSVSAHLIPYRDRVLEGEYDYICFLHDKLSAPQGRKLGESFADRCFSAMCENKNVVENIINIFEENKYIGIISPAPIYHGNCFHMVGGNWTKNFKKVKELTENFELDVNINGNEPPVGVYGGMFWARPQAIKKLFMYKWTYEEFPEEPIDVTDGTLLSAIERFYSVVAQSAGYLSAYVLNDSQSRSETTNLTAAARELALITGQHSFHRIAASRIKKGATGMDYEKAYNEVISSNSWKITKPLRLVSGTVRRMFKKGK